MSPIVAAIVNDVTGFFREPKETMRIYINHPVKRTELFSEYARAVRLAAYASKSSWSIDEMANAIKELHAHIKQESKGVEVTSKSDDKGS